MSAGHLLLSSKTFYLPHTTTTTTTTTSSSSSSSSNTHFFFFSPHHQPNLLHTRRCNNITFRRHGHSRPLTSSLTPNAGGSGEDFVTKVLKENPSQVEPRFLVGGRFLTLREKEALKKKEAFRHVRRGREKVREKGEEEEGESAEPVYLKDVLKEFKGELYVPEQVLREDLSEEEEFERGLQELPKMDVEDFRNFLKADKVELLTSKSVLTASMDVRDRDFIVDLKEIPGDKSLQQKKW